MREKTERPEGVEAGAARLVGTDSERIFSEAAAVLATSPAGPDRPRPINPYGDGRAADRIARILAGSDWTPFLAESEPSAAALPSRTGGRELSAARSRKP